MDFEAELKMPEYEVYSLACELQRLRRLVAYLTAVTTNQVVPDWIDMRFFPKDPEGKRDYSNDERLTISNRDIKPMFPLLVAIRDDLAKEANVVQQKLVTHALALAEDTHDA